MMAPTITPTSEPDDLDLDPSARLGLLADAVDMV
jgi:hypothetical protein